MYCQVLVWLRTRYLDCIYNIYTKLIRMGFLEVGIYAFLCMVRDCLQMDYLYCTSQPAPVSYWFLFTDQLFQYWANMTRNRCMESWDTISQIPWCLVPAFFSFLSNVFIICIDFGVFFVFWIQTAKNRIESWNCCLLLALHRKTGRGHCFLNYLCSFKMIDV